MVGTTVCAHEDIEVIPPCCTVRDSDTGYISCSCGGLFSVYCPTCQNEDVSEEDVEKAINQYSGHEGDYDV